MRKTIHLNRFFGTTLLALCAVLFATNTWAEDIWTRDKLSGDWGGLRTKMAEHGLKHDLRLTQFYQGVTNGGKDTNSEYGGKFDYLLNVDGHKLGLWPGFFVTMHAEIQFGHTILDDAGLLTLSNTMMLYPLPEYHDPEITGLLLMQALSKNFALAAGKINVVDLWSMVYPHTGGGIDGFMNTNLLAEALPWFRWVNLSVQGAGALVLSDDEQIRGGLLVFDTHNSTTTYGFGDLFDDGVATLGLWRFFFDVASKPGSLMFAAGTSTRDYNSLAKSDWGFDPGVGLSGETKNDTWTAGIFYNQIIWQAADNDKKNMRLFTGYSISDGNPSFSKSGVFLTVEGWGLIPSRDKDRMGIGGYYNELSSDLKDLTSTLHPLDDTWGFELYYNAEVTPWLHISADAQFASNATEEDSTATILGLRAVIEL